MFVYTPTYTPRTTAHKLAELDQLLDRLEYLHRAGRKGGEFWLLRTWAQDLMERLENEVGTDAALSPDSR